MFLYKSLKNKFRGESRTLDEEKQVFNSSSIPILKNAPCSVPKERVSDLATIKPKVGDTTQQGDTHSVEPPIATLQEQTMFAFNEQNNLSNSLVRNKPRNKVSQDSLYRKNRLARSIDLSKRTAHRNMVNNIEQLNGPVRDVIPSLNTVREKSITLQVCQDVLKMSQKDPSIVVPPVIQDNCFRRRAPSIEKTNDLYLKEVEKLRESWLKEATTDEMREKAEQQIELIKLKGLKNIKETIERERQKQVLATEKQKINLLAPTELTSPQKKPNKVLLSNSDIPVLRESCPEVNIAKVETYAGVNGQHFSQQNQYPNSPLFQIPLDYNFVTVPYFINLNNPPIHFGKSLADESSSPVENQVHNGLIPNSECTEANPIEKVLSTTTQGTVEEDVNKVMDIQKENKTNAESSIKKEMKDEKSLNLNDALSRKHSEVSVNDDTDDVTSDEDEDDAYGDDNDEINKKMNDEILKKRFDEEMEISRKFFEVIRPWNKGVCKAYEILDGIMKDDVQKESREEEPAVEFVKKSRSMAPTAINFETPSDGLPYLFACSDLSRGPNPSCDVSEGQKDQHLTCTNDKSLSLEKNFRKTLDEIKILKRSFWSDKNIALNEEVVVNVTEEVNVEQEESAADGETKQLTASTEYSDMVEQRRKELISLKELNQKLFSNNKISSVFGNSYFWSEQFPHDKIETSSKQLLNEFDSFFMKEKASESLYDIDSKFYEYTSNVNQTESEVYSLSDEFPPLLTCTELERRNNNTQDSFHSYLTKVTSDTNTPHVILYQKQMDLLFGPTNENPSPKFASSENFNNEKECCGLTADSNKKNISVPEVRAEAANYRAEAPSNNYWLRKCATDFNEDPSQVFGVLDEVLPVKSDLSSKRIVHDEVDETFTELSKISGLKQDESNVITSQDVLSDIPCNEDHGGKKAINNDITGMMQISVISNENQSNITRVATPSNISSSPHMTDQKTKVRIPSSIFTQVYDDAGAVGDVDPNVLVEDVSNNCGRVNTCAEEITDHFLNMKQQADDSQHPMKELKKEIYIQNSVNLNVKMPPDELYGFSNHLENVIGKDGQRNEAREDSSALVNEGNVVENQRGEMAKLNETNTNEDFEFWQLENKHEQQQLDESGQQQLDESGQKQLDESGQQQLDESESDITTLKKQAASFEQTYDGKEQKKLRMSDLINKQVVGTAKNTQSPQSYICNFKAKASENKDIFIKKTKHGFSLSDCLQLAQSNVVCSSTSARSEFIACDTECYNLHADLLSTYISTIHQNLHVPEQLKSSNSGFNRLSSDASENLRHIVDVTYELRRNLANRSFPIASVKHNKEMMRIERLLKSCCRSLNEQFKGTLSPILQRGDESIQDLSSKGILMRSQYSKYSGMYKTKGGKIVVFFNEEDHFRITTTNRQGDFKKALTDAATVEHIIHDWLKNNDEDFAWNETFGYLCPNPFYMGMGCTVYVTLELHHVDSFLCLDELMKLHNIELRKENCHKRMKQLKIYTFFTKTQFNTSEVDTSLKLIKFIRLLSTIDDRIAADQSYADLMVY